MRWIVCSKTFSREFYQLLHNDKNLLTLEYHPQTNSARIEWEDKKRVFLITKEGSLEQTIVLRNEYGIEIGLLEPGKQDPLEGMIELDEKRFTYQVSTQHPSFNLYTEDSASPQITCKIDNTNDHSGIKFLEDNTLSNPIHFLLISMCWYLSLPAANRHIPEYSF